MILNDLNGNMQISENYSLKGDKLHIETRIGAALFPSYSLRLSVDTIAHIRNKYYQDIVKEVYNAAI